MAHCRTVPASGGTGSVRFADLLRRSWTLRVDSLAPGQHLYELLDASRSGLDLLCVSDSIEDGVPVRTCELAKHRPSLGIGSQGVRQVLWNFHAGLSGVRGIPSPIGFCPPNLVFPYSIHPTGGVQPLGNGDVPLRPRAPSISGRESPPDDCAVTTPELPIDPAKADRLVECLVIGERCWVCSALPGKDEPHSLRLGPVAAQPGPPLAASATSNSGRSTAHTVSPL